MIPGGSDPFGWTQEPGGDGDDGHRAGRPAEGAGGDVGGWVPPSARSWRHPSELGGSPSGGSPSGGSTDRDDLARAALGAGRAPRWSGTTALRTRARRRSTTLGVATLAMTAVAIGSFLLFSTVDGPGTPQAAVAGSGPGPVTAAASCCHFTAAVIRRAVQGLVSIERPGGGSLLGFGVVLAGGGLVATTADAVARHRTLRVITAGGEHLAATVMAVDPGSDVALLSVPAGLSVARFAGDDDVDGGFPAVTVVLQPHRGRTADEARWWRAAVTSVGSAVPDGSAAGMAAIMVDDAALPDVPGQPLLDADGEVLGLLDRSGAPGGSGLRPFLPSSLVVGVAEQLAATGKVDHGWLGLRAETVTSAPTAVASTAVATTAVSSTTTASSLAGRATTGAEVVAVDAGGAAAGAFRPGEIIVAVNGQPVRSMAELRDRLYVLSPGTRATVTALEGDRALTEVVELASSP